MSKRLIWIAAVAGAALVGSVAFAAIPGSNGVITSCYRQATGTWRPIDVEKSPSEKCKSGDAAELELPGPERRQGRHGTAGACGTSRAGGADWSHRANRPDRASGTRWNEPGFLRVQGRRGGGRNDHHRLEDPSGRELRADRSRLDVQPELCGYLERLLRHFRRQGRIQLPRWGTDNGNGTLTSAISHAGGAVLLTCTETSGNFDVEHASLTAIKVDSLG
jgi:hypothetical protein